MTVHLFLALGLLAPSICSAGLLAHWKLEGSPADETRDFPASWEGEPAYTGESAAPVSSIAGSFSNRWLNAGYGFNFERHQAFSVSAWLKGGAQDSAIVGDMAAGESSQGWELHVGTTDHGADHNSVTVWLINDYPALAIQVSASLPVLDGQWHQVGFSYDGSSTAEGVKIYIDGVEVPCSRPLDTLGGSIANNSAAQLGIGTRMSGAKHNFEGALDELAIFNHPLSAAEMAAIHQTGVESIAHPFIVESTPLPAQSVADLAAATVKFSFPVVGVDAADFQVNGAAATAVETLDEKSYRFTFPTPPQGDVIFSWAADHGIVGTNDILAQPAGWTALFVPVLPAGQVIISEFLTRNAGGLEDEDHDTPDWIELYNPGTVSVNLADWALTYDPAHPRAWVLPAIQLLPQARLLVFASGKNRAAVGGNLHTHFKLASEGGYLALADPSGTIVHRYDGYPQQEANVSFGLANGGLPAAGRAAWRYLTPTPKAAPTTQLSAAAIAALEFSPANPAVGDPITITLRVSPEAIPTLRPMLTYRRMHGNEFPINFSDDGLHGDGAANDGLWGATIPPGAGAGVMVRWKVSLRIGSVVSRWPINTHPNESLPLYEGTVIGGNSPSQPLPVYQVFVPNYVIPTTTNQSGIDSDGGGRGAFFGNGRLYDNVLIRIKGTTSRYLLKRSHRVDFNPGRDFEWSTHLHPQRELNLNSEFNDPSYLRQNQQLWMHRDSGRAGAPHFPVRLLMNGAPWQLAFHTYSADSELVETMGLNPRGALYKQVGTLATGSGAEKKSRRWESSADYTQLKSGIASSASLESKSRYVFDNFNLPAVINYLAVTRLAQEADDVWANMVIYRDTEGTGEWQPIPFDLNLSFGQLFYGGVADNTTVHGDHDGNKAHPLYGSLACQPTLYPSTGWNRLYDAIIQNQITRAMLLRRIRTLTDRYLTTSAATSPLDANFDLLGATIRADADADRARWGLPPTTGGFIAYGLGPGISPAQGIATLKSNFLQPRRTHFYVTHSIHNPNKPLGIGNNHKAGIPDAQIANPVVRFGRIESRPASGNPNQQYIELTNPSTDAIDVSDWMLHGGGGSFTMKGGTVIAPNSSLFVAPSVVGFRSRSTSPKANENRQVVGPYRGHLSRYGETLRLKTADGTPIAQAIVPADPTAPAITLAITEVLSSSSHTTKAIDGDWWELTNIGPTALDLTGFSWDDDHGLAGQAIFPKCHLAAGESLLVLNEDDAGKAAIFRAAWNLPNTVQILTREDFGLADLTGLGNGDSVVVFAPDGNQVARVDYPAHQTGKSRAWFRDGSSVAGGYSVAGRDGAVASNPTPADTGSPGSALNPPAIAAVYQQWTTAHRLEGLAAEPTADPDHDGRSNRDEYLFGGDPQTADGPPAQAVTPTPDGLDWTIAHRGDDPTVVFTLEGSTDLSDWKPITPPRVNEVPDLLQVGLMWFTYRIERDAKTQFLRVRAE